MEGLLLEAVAIDGVEGLSSMSGRGGDPWTSGAEADCVGSQAGRGTQLQVDGPRRSPLEEAGRRKDAVEGSWAEKWYRVERRRMG